MSVTVVRLCTCTGVGLDRGRACRCRADRRRRRPRPRRCRRTSGRSRPGRRRPPRSLPVRPLTWTGEVSLTLSAVADLTAAAGAPGPHGAVRLPRRTSRSGRWRCRSLGHRGAPAPASSRRGRGAVAELTRRALAPGPDRAVAHQRVPGGALRRPRRPGSRWSARTPAPASRCWPSCCRRRAGRPGPCPTPTRAVTRDAVGRRPADRDLGVAVDAAHRDGARRAGVAALAPRTPVPVRPSPRPAGWRTGRR